MELPRRELCNAHAGRVAAVGILLRDGFGPNDTRDPEIKTTLVTVGQQDRCVCEWEGSPTQTFSPFTGDASREAPPVTIFAREEVSAAEDRDHAIVKALEQRLEDGPEDRDTGRLLKGKRLTEAVLSTRNWADVVLKPLKPKVDPKYAKLYEEDARKNGDDEDYRSRPLGNAVVERVYGFRTQGLSGGGGGGSGGGSVRFLNRDEFVSVAGAMSIVRDVARPCRGSSTAPAASHAGALQRHHPGPIPG